MKLHISAGLLLAAGCLSSAAAAATTTAPAAPAGVLAPLFNASVPTAAGEIPANTVVELELVDPVGSETSHKGDFFKLRVAVPVVVDGKEVVPAGTPAVGQVVHAAKAGAGGKGGELLLAARYLELPSGQVKLRASFGVAGQGHVVASLVTAQFVGPLAMFIRGKHVELPVGSRISARIAPATPASTATAPAPTAASADAAAPASP